MSEGPDYRLLCIEVVKSFHRLHFSPRGPTDLGEIVKEHFLLDDKQARWLCCAAGCNPHSRMRRPWKEQLPWKREEGGA